MKFYPTDNHSREVIKAKANELFAKCVSGESVKVELSCIFVLHTDASKQFFKALIQLILKFSHTVSDLLFTFSKKHPRRTNKQNSYLHLLLAMFAMEMGIPLETAKSEYFKELWNPDIFVREKDTPLGKAKIIRSTTELDTKEMTDAINKFKRECKESTLNLTLPDPDEEQWLKQIEKQYEFEKQYLKGYF